MRLFIIVVLTTMAFVYVSSDSKDFNNGNREVIEIGENFRDSLVNVLTNKNNNGDRCKLNNGQRCTCNKQCKSGYCDGHCKPYPCTTSTEPTTSSPSTTSTEPTTSSPSSTSTEPTTSSPSSTSTEFTPTPLR